MPKIPESEIDRIKREVSLERLVTAHGMKLTRRGRDLVGRCPFHDDKTPSFVITPDKNLWHCFGACDAGGSNIDYVMKSEGLDFRQAIEQLKVMSGRVSSTREKSVTDLILQRPSSSIQWECDDHEIMKQVVAYYHATLKQSPDALAYLKKRGLDSSEMIAHFKLGFANRTLAQGVPMSKHKEGAKIRSRLCRLGLYKESGFEHFRGSVVIPIMDEAGNVQGMYGRKICDNVNQRASSLHLYLPGPHKGIFNIAALAESKEIILCESLIDALTFWCAGYQNVTASYGTNGFTDDHVVAFKKYGIQKVYIAYDRDDAGDSASISLAERLSDEGIESFRIQFPKGMDANEYALKMLPADKSLGLLIRCAVRMGPQRGGADLPLLAGHAAPLVAEKEVPVEANFPLPPISSLEISVEVKDQEIVVPMGDRRYRVRGLSKNMSNGLLKINLFVAINEGSVPGGLFYVDTIDLYSSKARGLYIKEAAKELMLEESVIKKDLGQILLRLEALQEQQIKETLSPKEKRVVLTKEEESAAFDLLKDPNLLGRILSDFERCGVVGEETNKLVGYLAATSRKLDAPLAVLIQSSSAAGKTALMEAVLSFMPKEEVVKYSAMTGQSLFYMEGINLKHKILAIAEGEGAARASYALKLLQSEGELTIASTGKDPNTGRMITQEYRMEGPTSIFSTTTVDEVDEEFLNRCLALSANEDREQTRAIHKLQRERHTPEGLWARQEAKGLRALHQNAQRLLRALPVANPYARALTFLDDKTRTRRDHEKYLTLIEAIALLHQYQRPIKQESRDGTIKEYIEVTVQDIAIANRLANEVLGRSLDELPPQTRKLLIRIDQMVKEVCERLKVERSDYRFSRKAVREFTGWGNTQLKIHLQRLEELEYLLVHRGGRGQSFVYEFQYEGQGQKGETFLMGLIDVRHLNGRYEENLSGFKTEKSGSSRPQVGGVSVECRPAQTVINSSNGNGFIHLGSENSQNAYSRSENGRH